MTSKQKLEQLNKKYGITLGETKSQASKSAIVSNEGSKKASGTAAKKLQQLNEKYGISNVGTVSTSKAPTVNNVKSQTTSGTTSVPQTSKTASVSALQNPVTKEQNARKATTYADIQSKRMGVNNAALGNAVIKSNAKTTNRTMPSVVDQAKILAATGGNGATGGTISSGLPTGTNIDQPESYTKENLAGTSARIAALLTKQNLTQGEIEELGDYSKVAADTVKNNALGTSKIEVPAEIALKAEQRYNEEKNKLSKILYAAEQGLLKGIGAEDAIETYSALAGVNDSAMQEYAQRDQRIQKNSPTAYKAGEMAGSLALAGGIGKGIEAATPAGSVIPGALKTGMTWGTAAAVKNLGELATGEMSEKQYVGNVAAETGISALGSLASGQMASDLSKTALANTRAGKAIIKGITRGEYVAGTDALRRAAQEAGIVGGEKITFKDAALDTLFGVSLGIAEQGVQYLATDVNTALKMDAANSSRLKTMADSIPEDRAYYSDDVQYQKAMNLKNTINRAWDRAEVNTWTNEAGNSIYERTIGFEDGMSISAARDGLDFNGLQNAIYRSAYDAKNQAESTEQTAGQGTGENNQKYIGGAVDSNVDNKAVYPALSLKKPGETDNKASETNAAPEQQTKLENTDENLLAETNAAQNNTVEQIDDQEASEKAEEQEKSVSSAAQDEEKDSTIAQTHKEIQNQIIQKANPAKDDLHAWIRSADDIETFSEGIEELATGPDFTQEDAQKALETGEVTVYSSHPIKNGTWVTPSKMEAQNYAGDGKIYSKTVSVNDVAWLKGAGANEGQLAVTNLTNNLQSASKDLSLEKPDTVASNESEGEKDLRLQIPEDHDEESSLKEQVRRGIERTKGMQPVAVINAEKLTSRRSSDIAEYAKAVLRKIGSVITRKNFGKVIISDNDIEGSAGYGKSDADIIAYEAIPDVIKYGEIVDGHENHKHRNYPTITFAAPVRINGKDGVMAVVVKQIKSNNSEEKHYKIHKVLTPEGKEIRFDENKKEAAGTGRIPSVEGPHHTESASNKTSVPQKEENSNKLALENPKGGKKDGETGSNVQREGRVGRNVALSEGKQTERVSGVSEENEGKWSVKGRSRDEESRKIEFLDKETAGRLTPVAVPGQSIYIPKTDTPSMKIARMQAKKEGVRNVIFFASDGLIKLEGGENARAGYVPATDTIWVRINDGDASSDMLMPHELVERGIIQRKIFVNKAIGKLKDAIGDKKLTDILNQYVQVDTSDLSPDEADEIFEDAARELICDLGGGINQFEGAEGYEDLAETVYDAISVMAPYLNEKLDGALLEGYVDTTINGDPNTFDMGSVIPTITDAKERHSTSLFANPAPKEKIKISAGGDATFTTLRDKSGEIIKISGKQMLEDAIEKYDYRNGKYLMDTMKKAYDLQKNAGIKYKFINIDDVNEAKIIVSPRDGSIVLRAMVSNGEYPVNFDLTKECTRRIDLARFINRALMEGNGNLTQHNLTELNKILRDAGYNTACLGCFVETRRYNIKKWAETFVSKYNTAVLKENPKAEYFGFTDMDMHSGQVSKEEADALENDVARYEASKAERVKEKRIREKNEDVNLTNEENIEELVASGKEFQKLLTPADLITTEGRTNLHRNFPELESLVLGHYGSNTPKSVEAFTPYNNEYLMMDEKVGKELLKDYLYGIGGGRSQSFSDNIITHFFDKLQKTADMAVRGLPEQEYTKQPWLVKLFGLNGTKRNMSIMFNIDPDVPASHAGLRADGSLFIGDKKTQEQEAAAGREHTFDQSFPFDEAIELQHTPGYSKDNGIIGVGYSWYHNQALMDNDEFGYIIGYHSSGMNPVLALASHINMATDYTGVQNNYPIAGFRKITAKCDGIPSYASWPRGVSKEMTKEKISKNAFDIKGNLQKYGGMQTLRKLLDWCEKNQYTVEKNSKAGKNEHGVGSYPFYEKLREFGGNYYKVADDYAGWCLEKGWLPVFFEFAGNDGWYKFLADYTMYDHAEKIPYMKNTPKWVKKSDDGKMFKPSLQGPVTFEMPKNWPEMFDQALNEWNEYFKRQAPKEEETYRKVKEQLGHYQLTKDEIISDMKALTVSEMKQLAPQLKKPVDVKGMNAEDMRTAIAKALHFNSKEDYFDFKADERHSSPIMLDKEYMNAVNSGEIEEAKNLVEYAAIEAGYTDKMYHGTDVRGFSEFHGNRYSRTPGITFFTDRRATAKEYGGSKVEIDFNKKNYFAFRDYDEGTADELMVVDAVATDREIYTKNGEKRYKFKYEGKSYDLSKNSLIDFVNRIGSGTYEVFGKPGNQLVIDCKGHTSKNIPLSNDIGEEYKTTDSVSRWAKGNGYDSVKFTNIIDNAHGEKETVFAYMDGNSVKSANAVVRDDNGSIIPLSERFNDKKRDIRYSSKLNLQHPDDIINAERKRREDQDNGLKLENPRVKKAEPKLSSRDLKKEIRKIFSIPTRGGAEVTKKIDEIGEKILKDGRISSKDRDELLDVLYENGSVAVDVESTAKAARELLVGKTIYVPEFVRQEYGDDWNDFRRKMFANKIYLSTDKTKTNVAEMAAQLNEYVGQLFSEDDEVLALQEMAYYAEEGKPKFMNLYSEAKMMEDMYGRGSGQDYLDDLAKEMDKALRGFAYKAGIEVDLRERINKEIADRIERQDISARNKQAMRDIKRLRKRMGMNDTRLAEAMENLSPEDKLIAELVIKNISTSAQRLTKKAMEKMKLARETYEAKLEEDPNYIPDKATLDMLQEMDRDYLHGKSIEELSDIHRTITALMTHLNNLEKEIGDQRHEEFSDLFGKSSAEIKASEGRKRPSGKISAGAQKLKDEEQLTPMNFIEMLSGWDDKSVFYDAIGKQLEDGEREKKKIIVEMTDMVKDFKEKNQEWIAKSDGEGKDAKWIELRFPALITYDDDHKPVFGEDEVVYVTPAMMVELARGARNDDNLRHAEGGVTFPDKELYSNGLRKEAYAHGKTVKIAPETMRLTFRYENLDKEGKELFNLMDKVFDGYSKDKINATSQIMDGVDRAMTKHYSKIFTNKNYRASDMTIDESIGGIGSLKTRVMSKNPMYAMSVWDAFDDNMDTVSKYAAMAIPVRNVQTLLNWKENGQAMKDIIAQKWGDGAVTYLENLVKNMSNKHYEEKSGIEQFGDAVLSNYITATFGFNPGIVLKQFASFPSAAAVLGFDTVPNIKQINNVDPELIKKYTPELAYRSMGWSTAEIAELKKNPNWTQKNKVTRFIFGGAIQAMDYFTVKSMWPWSENYVKKHYPQLAAGSDAFYKKVAEIYNEATSETQPMYDEMHRANIMKHASVGTRAFTLFKTVPMQQQNMIRKAFNEWKSAKPGTETKTSKGKEFAATIIALVLANIMFEGIEYLNQLWKNKGKNYTDESGEQTAKSVGTEMAKGVIEDFIGTVIGGDEIVEAVKYISGDSWKFEIDTPGLSQVVDLVNTVGDFTKEIGKIAEEVANLKKNDGSIKQYAKENHEELFALVKDTASELALYLTGIPVSNIEKYIIGTLDWISPELAEEYQTLFDETNKTDLKGLKGDELEVRVKDLVRDRFDASDEAIDELVRLYEEDNADCIPSDAPSTISINGEDVKLSASQKQKYNEVFREMMNGQIETMINCKEYSWMSEAMKADTLKKLYNLAREYAKYELGQDQSTAIRNWKAAKKAGIDAGTYIAITADMSYVPHEEDARKIIQEADITGEQKLALYENVVLKDEDKQKEIISKLSDEDPNNVLDTMCDMKNASGKADKIGKLAESKLSEAGKKEVYYNLVLESGVSEEKQLVSIGAKAGINFNEYLKHKAVMSSYKKETDSSGETTKSKQDKVVEYIKKQPESKQKALWQIAGYSLTTFDDKMGIKEEKEEETGNKYLLNSKNNKYLLNQKSTEKSTSGSTKNLSLAKP